MNFCRKKAGLNLYIFSFKFTQASNIFVTAKLRANVAKNPQKGEVSALYA